MDSESLKILDIRLRKVGGKKTVKKDRKPKKTVKKNNFLFVFMGQKAYLGGISGSIPIGRESRCLRCAGFLFFKASPLWADAFFKSKCQCVCSVCPSVHF